MRLTRRQREVLSLLAAGYSDREIAGQLGIGTDTVGDYVKAIYREFGVGTRVAAAHIYWRAMTGRRRRHRQEAAAELLWTTGGDR